MNELQEIGDLRPAPRASTPAVLWTMFSVMAVGAGALLWTGSDTHPAPGAVQSALPGGGVLATASAAPFRPPASTPGAH